MSKKLLLLFIVFFSLLILNTIETTEENELPDTTQEANKITFSKENGKLILHTPQNEHCLLATDAIAYEPYVSPHGTWIAVEIQLLSNLQIIRIYRKDRKGCYHALQPPFSTKVWQKIARKQGFTFEDVIHPRMQFIKWIDNEHLQIEVLGEVSGRSIDEKLVYGLIDTI